MAELLIVVAVITVLSGIGFVSVQSYQRSMALLERDAIAKEIFVAAQNHLTMADGQGYMGVDAENIALSDDGTHLVLFDGSNTDPDAAKMLAVMLPFGAIDETVRGAGRYYIHYQTNPGRVLDVFYWTPGGRFGGSNTGYGDMYANRQNRNWRKGNSPVIGWYGGEGTVETGSTIEMPSIEVENAERLLVRVTNPNKDNPAAELKLIVKGVTSGAMKAITVLEANIDPRIKDPDATGNVYTIVLDDITDAALHFAQLGADTGEFLSGEDITVQAVAFSNSELTNIAYSAEVTTNSLFADVEEVVGAEGSDPIHTAMVGNIRHLENLDEHVSDLRPALGITAAKQIADLSAPPEGAEDADDLSWTGFVAAIKEAKELSADSHIKVYDAEGTGTTDDCFRPVSPTYALNYDGQGHSISGIVVSNDSDAGLFGALKSGSGISNLELVDFSIATTSGNAGALAGTLTGTTVTNVAAHNSGNGMEATVTGTGSAGGLIGSVSGGAVEKSAAALVVSGGDAGGLIGKASDGATITASYAGGHTKDATYYDGETPIYNVTGTGSAGGLIGDAGNAAITDSYATASATGATAGGFAGKSSGSITDCYATGLVSGTAETSVVGAFAGELTGSAAGCLYYEIINEGMPATGNTPAEGSNPDITALDADMTTYNAFIQSETDPASPYDGTLANLYGEGNYNLKTVGQLDDALDLTDQFVATHYGDWPAPEQLVINK